MHAGRRWRWRGLCLWPGVTSWFVWPALSRPTTSQKEDWTEQDGRRLRDGWSSHFSHCVDVLIKIAKWIAKWTSTHQEWTLEQYLIHLSYSEGDYSTILLLFVFSPPKLMGGLKGGKVVKWSERERNDIRGRFSVAFCERLSQEEGEESHHSVDVYVKPARRAKTPTTDEDQRSQCSFE